MLLLFIVFGSPVPKLTGVVKTSLKVKALATVKALKNRYVPSLMVRAWEILFLTLLFCEDVDLDALFARDLCRIRISFQLLLRAPPGTRQFPLL